MRPGSLAIEEWIRGAALAALLFAPALSSTGCGEPTEARADDVTGSPEVTDRLPRARIREVASPFAQLGSAYLIEAPPTETAIVQWSRDDIEPGETYTLSFFFGLAGQPYVDPTPDAINRESAHVQIFDGDDLVFTNRLQPVGEPRFFRQDVTFANARARLELQVQPGRSLLIGNLGEAIPSSHLKWAFPFGTRASDTLRLPDDVLPRVYRGLRALDIEVGINRRGDRRNEEASLGGVRVVGLMNIATGLLPRVLPGHNDVVIAGEPAGPGAAVSYQLMANEHDGDYATLDVAVDSSAPADGATFAKALLTPRDADGRPIPGMFFRLRGPDAVVAIPYTVAISDNRTDQQTREFHVLSRAIGTHHIAIERWDRRGWVDTGRSFRIEFTPSDAPAPAFERSTLAQPWFTPSVIEGDPAPIADRFELTGSQHPRTVVLRLPTATMPRIAWTLAGPVQGARLFNAAFQPDPCSLRTLGRSLRQRNARAGGDDASLAMMVEDYIGLLRYANVQEDYDGRQTYWPARVIRKGRGWCGPHAMAVFGVAVSAGLDARITGTSSHVVTEVRSGELDPLMLDANLEIALCDTSGRRGNLDLLSDPQHRCLGLSTAGLTRPGDLGHEMIANYLTARAYATPWSSAAQPSPLDRVLLADERLACFDLRSWERVEWIGGAQQPTDGLLDKHHQQTTVRKTAELWLSRDAEHPDIALDGLVETTPGRWNIAEDADSGRVRFRFRAPIEIDRLSVDLVGTLGDCSGAWIAITPTLEAALFKGQPRLE